MDGEERLIFADRGHLGTEGWDTGGVVAVDMQGRMLWERRDLTRETGHRLGDVWPVHLGSPEGTLFAAGEIGGWGGTRHRGIGEYAVYLLTREGELAQTVVEHDTGYNGKGSPYTGATGMGFHGAK